MKILMLNTEYPPLGGGQATANYFIYQALQKYADLQVDIVTASTHKFHTETSKIGTIYYLNIGKKNQNLQTQSISDLIRYSIKSLFKAFSLRKNNYDLVVAWTGVPAGFLALIYRILLGIPYIVLLRGADVPFHEKKWKKLDKWIFSWLSPIIWKNAKGVVANSDKLRETALQSNPKQKIDIIYNGIDIEKFYPVVDKLQAKPLKIITVGRLSEIKGQRYLIQALQNTEAELYLIGDGDLREELENLAKNLHVSVHFLGFVPSDEIPVYLCQSHIFALPSLNEGMSNSLLEAMASGLPVIVTDVGGTKELLQDNGILVEKESAEAIRQAIQYYLDNPELMQKHGENSRKITENMSWETKTKEFYDYFAKK